MTEVRFKDLKQNPAYSIARYRFSLIINQLLKRRSKRRLFFVLLEKILMADIPDVPDEITNRPIKYPGEPWIGYQEWHDVINLHWRVNPEVLAGIVPPELAIDTFNDYGYISVIAFTVKNLRPRLIPSMSFISDFHEINVRTYVKHNGNPGIYFFSLEASKKIPVLSARLLTGLPYVKSDIWRDGGMYNSHNESHGFRFHVNYEKGDNFIKDELTTWLADRFRLYVKTSGNISQIDVHHQSWPLKQIKLVDLSLNYKLNDWPLSNKNPEIINFSEGVKVINWRKVKA
jgi:uncharacterized protein